MANILDIKSENDSFSLFVGESGSGKTAAIASYAKLGPMRIYDFDKRARGILGVRSIIGEDAMKNIDIQQYNIANSFREVDADLAKLVNLSKNGQCPFKTIVLESVNSLEGCFMNMVDALVETGAKGIGVKHQTVGGIRVYTPAHYKFAATAFRQLRDFRLFDLKGVHVILSCWVVNKWDKPVQVTDEGKEIRQQYADNVVVGKKLMLTDKMAEEVPGCFDDIYEFYKEERKDAPNGVRHGVRFYSSIAKTSNENLKKAGDVDLTNKCFIDEFQRLTKG